MKNGLNRRLFLKRAVLATGAVSTTGLLPGPNLLAALAPGDKLNIAQIGCGGRGVSAHLPEVIGRHRENLLAFVDPDERRQAVVRKWLKGRNLDPDKPRAFSDYRVMFDKVGKQIDAVFVAAPNHHHALASETAMELGKNVYCEKPVCHDIAEARKMRAMARRYQVATQMGNQGHCMEGYRRLCDYTWAGVVGNITETHSWTDRANGGVGPRPPALPTPPGMHWDSWIGPAPYRPYQTDLHPHEWHGWYDFGNGSIGNMGCHVLDGVFWALKVGHPTSIEAEYIRGGTNERYPLGCRVRYDVPARGDLPPLRVYWYDGLNPTTDAGPVGTLHAAVGPARNLPPLLIELQKKYPDEEFDKSGTLYVGDKGILYTGTYGGQMHILPWDKMNETPKPPVTLPRPKDIFTDFLDACRAGKTETSASFEYGTRLTEFVILADLAQRAGIDNRVDWDGPNMRVTNQPELNAWVKRPYREGWHA